MEDDRYRDCDADRPVRRDDAAVGLLVLAGWFAAVAVVSVVVAAAKLFR